jgi:hypothetical protein
MTVLISSSCFLWNIYIYIQLSTYLETLLLKKIKNTNDETVNLHF